MLLLERHRLSFRIRYGIRIQDFCNLLLLFFTINSIHSVVHKDYLDIVIIGRYQMMRSMISINSPFFFYLFILKTLEVIK